MLFRSENNSNHVHQILEYQKNIKNKQGIYEINTCNIMPFYEIKLPIDINEYNFRILDLGVLNQNNVDFFIEASIKACILGTKDWELKYSKRVLKLLSDQENVKYLFNFLDNKQFYAISNILNHIPCYSIPYEPDIKDCSSNQDIIHFIEGILNY